MSDWGESSWGDNSWDSPAEKHSLNPNKREHTEAKISKNGLSSDNWDTSWTDDQWENSTPVTVKPVKSKVSQASGASLPKKQPQPRRLQRKPIKGSVNDNTSPGISDGDSRRTDDRKDSSTLDNSHSLNFVTNTGPVHPITKDTANVRLDEGRPVHDKTAVDNVLAHDVLVGSSFNQFSTSLGHPSDPISSTFVEAPTPAPMLSSADVSSEASFPALSLSSVQPDQSHGHEDKVHGILNDSSALTNFHSYHEYVADTGPVQLSNYPTVNHTAGFRLCEDRIVRVEAVVNNSPTPDVSAETSFSQSGASLADLSEPIISTFIEPPNLTSMVDDVCGISDRNSSSALENSQSYSFADTISVQPTVKDSADSHIYEDETVHEKTAMDNLPAHNVSAETPFNQFSTSFAPHPIDPATLTFIESPTLTSMVDEVCGISNRDDSSALDNSQFYNFVAAMGPVQPTLKETAGFSHHADRSVDDQAIVDKLPTQDVSVEASVNQFGTALVHPSGPITSTFIEAPNPASVSSSADVSLEGRLRSWSLSSLQSEQSSDQEEEAHNISNRNDSSTLDNSQSYSFVADTDPVHPTVKDIAVFGVSEDGTIHAKAIMDKLPSHDVSAESSFNQFSTSLAHPNDPITSTFIEAPTRASMSSSADVSLETGFPALSLSSVQSERSFGQEDEVHGVSDDGLDRVEQEFNGPRGHMNGIVNGSFRSRSSGSYGTENGPHVLDGYDSHTSDSDDERRDGSRDHEDFSPSMSRSSYSTHSEDEEQHSQISAQTVNSVDSSWTMTDPMEHVMRAFGMVVPVSHQYPSFPDQDASFSYGFGTASYPPPSLAPLPPLFFPTVTAPTLGQTGDAVAPSMFLKKHLYPHAVGDLVQDVVLSLDGVAQPPVVDVFGNSARIRIPPEISRFPHDLSGKIPGTDDKVSTFCKFMEESTLQFASLNPVKRDEAVLWSLLSLLVRHGSSVRNFAISDILMGATRDPGLFSSTASLDGGGSIYNVESYPGERKLATVRRNLAAGLIPRACKAAEEQGRTPLAFMLLSLPSVIKTNNKTALTGFMRYVDRTMSSCDPIYTACSLMCGVGPRVMDCGKNWMEHVAVVIGCGVLIPSSAKMKFLQSLAESFDVTGKPVARDVLYLLSRPGPRVAQTELEMKLIGTDNTASSLLGKLSENVDKLFATEIFIYVTNKISQQHPHIPVHFVSPLQLEYLNFLLTCGATEESAAYLKCISSTVISSDVPVEPTFLISLFTLVVHNRSLLDADEQGIFEAFAERVELLLDEQSDVRFAAAQKIEEDRHSAEMARQAVLQSVAERQLEDERLRSEMAKLDQRRHSVTNFIGVPESSVPVMPVNHMGAASVHQPFRVEHNRTPSPMEIPINSRPQSSQSRSVIPTPPPSIVGQYPIPSNPVKSVIFGEGSVSDHVSFGSVVQLHTPSTSHPNIDSHSVEPLQSSYPESASGTWDEDDELTSFYRLPKKHGTDDAEAVPEQMHSEPLVQVEHTAGKSPQLEPMTVSTYDAIPMFTAPSDANAVPMMFSQGHSWNVQAVPFDHSYHPLDTREPPSDLNAEGKSEGVDSQFLNNLYTPHAPEDYSQLAERRESSSTSYSLENSGIPGTVDSGSQQPESSTDFSSTLPQSDAKDYYHLEYTQNPDGYYQAYPDYVAQSAGEQYQTSQPQSESWSSYQQQQQPEYGQQPQWNSGGYHDQGTYLPSDAYPPSDQSHNYEAWNQSASYQQYDQQQFGYQPMQQQENDARNWNVSQQPSQTPYLPSSSFQTVPLTQSQQPNYLQPHQPPYSSEPEIPDEEDDQKASTAAASAAAPPAESKPGLMGRFTGFFKRGSDAPAAPSSAAAVQPVPTLPVPPGAAPPLGPAMFSAPGGSFSQYPGFNPSTATQSAANTNGWANSGANQPPAMHPSSTPAVPGPTQPGGQFPQTGYSTGPAGGYIGAYHPTAQTPQLNARVAPGHRVPPLY